MNMAGLGDNSIASDTLRGFVERVERLKEEIKGLNDDIKDIKLEAKAANYNPSMITYLVKMRAMEKEARDDLLSEQEVYLAALGLA
jgi:uncharacterized protein (UPF0335 family)